MLNLLVKAPTLNIVDILIVVAIMLVIAVVFGFLIMVVSKKFAVPVDEREEEVLGCLAGANCGGCGKAGCSALAKAIVEGKSEIDDCPVTDKENKEKIAKVLGIDYSGGGAKKYVVLCNGGEKAKDKNDYLGVGDCVHENMILGGKKKCSTACLGDGTCSIVCKNGAIKVENGVAVIDQALCIKCGLCAKNCPKLVITTIPDTAKVYVACSTNCRGKEVIDACSNGCIGCGICAKNCPTSAITMINNLPHIDYEKCVSCGHCADKCPRKCIKKFD